jgi:chemotaxis response regulator CheB
MRIGIVNDTPVIAEALRRVVMQEHEVIWVAHGGEQALEYCAANRPDLILMDLVMPEMDGVETTRRIMAATPCAILIVTASPDQNTSLVFRALGAGALDVTAIPVVASDAGGSNVLLKKIRTIGRLIADDRPFGLTGGTPAAAPAAEAPAEMLVAIGASTGGPLALVELLHAWTPPANCALVIVQHIDLAFTDSLARWLAAEANVPIDMIEAGAPVTPGRILMARTNDHVRIDERQRFRYSVDPIDYPYRPSIDVFFHSIARHWKRSSVGVLLTGMGRDGAEGLLAMRAAGKSTIAQDEASSAVYGMPRAAAALNAAEEILPLKDIGASLRRKTGAASGNKGRRT